MRRSEVALGIMGFKILWGCRAYGLSCKDLYAHVRVVSPVGIMSVKRAACLHLPESLQDKSTVGYLGLTQKRKKAVLGWIIFIVPVNEP